VPASQVISQYLDTVGDGTGTTNGATTADTYFFAPTRSCQIHRMLVFIEDNVPVVAAKYGGLSALSTGIKVTHVSGGQTLNLHGQNTIKSNADWARVCYDVTYTVFGSGNDYVQARWTFAKSGIPILMESGDTLNAVVADDLTGLVGHYFMIQGNYT
jgi:hypothetical protein